MLWISRAVFLSFRSQHKNCMNSLATVEICRLTTIRLAANPRPRHFSSVLVDTPALAPVTLLLPVKAVLIAAGDESTWINHMHMLKSVGVRPFVEKHIVSMQMTDDRKAKIQNIHCCHRLHKVHFCSMCGSTISSFYAVKSM